MAMKIFPASLVTQAIELVQKEVSGFSKNKRHFEKLIILFDKRAAFFPVNALFKRGKSGELLKKDTKSNMQQKSRISDNNSSDIYYLNHSKNVITHDPVYGNHKLKR